MSNKEVSYEELLGLIDEAEKSVTEKKKPKTLKELNGVDEFIKGMDIQTGLDRIPTYVIFYTYRIIWDIKLNKDFQYRLRKIPFFREFNKHFNQVRTGKQRYYLLDKKSFDMSREGLIKAKQHRNREKISHGWKVKKD